MHYTSCNYRKNYFSSIHFSFMVYSIITASKQTQTMSLTSFKLLQLHCSCVAFFLIHFIGPHNDFVRSGRYWWRKSKSSIFWQQFQQPCTNSLAIDFKIHGCQSHHDYKCTSSIERGSIDRCVCDDRYLEQSYSD